MLLFVRHGDTQNGEQSGARGWDPTLLSKRGIEQANTAAKALVLTPDTFEASDLPRTMQTAKIFAQHLGMEPTINPNFRTWNIGDLTGARGVAADQQLSRLVQNPDQKAPNGESFNDFLNRTVPLLKQRVTDPLLHLVVGHSRDASVIDSLASPVGGVGEGLDQSILKDRPKLKAGGVMLVRPNWQSKVIQ